MCCRSPRRRRRTSPENGPVLQMRVGTSIERVEQRLILATLELTGGDKKKAAEILRHQLEDALQPA